MSELGREVYTRIGTMGEHLAKLGGRLDGAVARLQRDRSARSSGASSRRRAKLADHGAGGTKEIAPLEPVDRATQAPQAPELVESTEDVLELQQRTLEVA